MPDYFKSKPITTRLATYFENRPVNRLVSSKIARITSLPSCKKITAKNCNLPKMQNPVSREVFDGDSRAVSWISNSCPADQCFTLCRVGKTCISAERCCLSEFLLLTSFARLFCECSKQNASIASWRLFGSNDPAIGESRKSGPISQDAKIKIELFHHQNCRCYDQGDMRKTLLW